MHRPMASMCQGSEFLFIDAIIGTTYRILCFRQRVYAIAAKNNALDPRTTVIPLGQRLISSLLILNWSTDNNGNDSRTEVLIAIGLHPTLPTQNKTTGW